MRPEWKLMLAFFAVFFAYLVGHYIDRDLQREDDERYCAAVYLQQIPDYDKKYERICLSGTLKPAKRQ